MTLIEALRAGHIKVRKHIWAGAYLEIRGTNGYLSPWGELWDIDGQKAIGISSPQHVLLVGDQDDDWVACPKEVCK